LKILEKKEKQDFGEKDSVFKAQKKHYYLERKKRLKVKR